MSQHRYYGEISVTEALALEAEGDVSYRVRVIRSGSNGANATVGEAAYPKTLAGVEAAIDRLAKKWGPYASRLWHVKRPESCDVIVEARERRYEWDGTVMRGCYTNSWRLLDRRTVDVPAKEVAR